MGWEGYMSEGGKSATRLGILAPVIMASPKSTPRRTWPSPSQLFAPQEGVSVGLWKNRRDTTP